MTSKKWIFWFPIGDFNSLLPNSVHMHLSLTGRKMTNSKVPGRNCRTGMPIPGWEVHSPLCSQFLLGVSSFPSQESTGGQQKENPYLPDDVGLYPSCQPKAATEGRKGNPSDDMDIWIQVKRVGLSSVLYHELSVCHFWAIKLLVASKVLLIHMDSLFQA